MTVPAESDASLQVVLGWLEESGVHDAHAGSAVSSLDLLWILQRLEENGGVASPGLVEELGRHDVLLVSDVVAALARRDGSA